MNVGQVVVVKLLDSPPSKGLGRGLDEVVAVAVEVVLEADVASAELSELESSEPEAVPLAVDVDDGFVIPNVVVMVLAAAALLRSSFSSGSSIVHLPMSFRAGTCVSSNNVSARYGAAVGLGSSSKRGDASV